MCWPVGALIVTLRCPVNETFLTKISYVLIAVFTVQEIAICRFLKHIWSTIFFIYTVYALLPVRLLAAIIAGLTLAFVHLPFYFYSSDYGYYELHWKTVNITIRNSTIIISMQIRILWQTHFVLENLQRYCNLFYLKIVIIIIGHIFITTKLC